MVNFLYLYIFNSFKFLNCSRASGFAKASMFLISLPSIIFLTASSTIFPFFVLGISLTTIILLGTCLGDAFFLICNFIFLINLLLIYNFYSLLQKELF